MPDVSRRNLLKFLGLTPAIPLIAKMPQIESQEIPAKEPVSFNAVSTTGFVSSGFCAPMDPLYDLPSEGRPMRDSLPTIKADRGGIRYR